MISAVPPKIIPHPARDGKSTPIKTSETVREALRLFMVPLSWSNAVNIGMGRSVGSTMR